MCISYDYLYVYLTYTCSHHVYYFCVEYAIQASGLAAGKGVILPTTHSETVTAVNQILLEQIFGPEASREIVIEEFLEGEEVSILAFTDGKVAIPMPPAQDHKRVYDGDEGPNTGGMGAYTPAPVLTPALRKQCHALIQVILILCRSIYA